jgi:uncharacterized membrane protein
MKTVTIHQPCAAPVEVVWAVATDLANLPAAIDGITGTEVHTDGEFRVGTRWTETRTMFGRQASETMTITAVEPGRSHTAEAESSGMRYTTTWQFAATEDGSEIVMIFGGQPTGTLGKVMSPAMGLMTRSVEKAMRQDMADLATYAESRM